MQVCDFSRSYLGFCIDLQQKPPITVSQSPPFSSNTIRILLECRCKITDGAGKSTQYVLGAACKSEQVNVPENIWHQPNADFRVIMSDARFLLIKSWDKCDKGVMLYPPSLGVQPERQTGTVEDAWARSSIEVHETAARALQSNDQIIEATLAGHPLVAHSEFQTEDGLHVWLEYPVKTINIGERDRFYQVDTGPVIVPDGPGDGEDPIGRMRPAFVAHNCPDWAEFIINVPTAVSDDVKVNHYSKAQRVDATNTMLAIQ